MFGRALALSLAFLGLAACALPAHAFDGQRKGFILGVGAGLGVSSFTQTLDVSGLGSETSDRETKVGVAADFRIGWGVDDQLLLYYDNRANWFSVENVFDESVTLVDGLSTFGASYYFQPAAPSAFVTGGIGWATWTTPFEEESSGALGFGLYGGGGYEFNKLLSVEGSISYGMPSDEASGVKLTTDSIGLRLMLVLMGY